MIPRQEISQELGIDLDTLGRWTRLAGIPHKKISGVVFMDQEGKDLLRFIKEHRNYNRYELIKMIFEK